MHEIKAYQTKDGRIFSTAEEARDHEESIEWDKVIGVFMDSPYCPYRHPQLSMVRKTIIAWERWKADGGINAIRKQT